MRFAMFNILHTLLMSISASPKSSVKQSDDTKMLAPFEALISPSFHFTVALPQAPVKK